MQPGLRTEIQRLVALTIGLLGIGHLIGYPLITLLAGGAGYFLLSFHHFRRITAWLASDREIYPPEVSGLWSDITDPGYRLKKALEARNRDYTGLALRIRQITSALDDGMILLEPDGSLEWWNPAANEMLRLRADDKGEYLGNLVRNPLFVDFLHQDTFDQPLELYSPYDPHRIFQFSAGRYGQGDIVLVMRDITRLRNLEEMRKEFVANISHELRTPLTVLTGYIETLQDDSDNIPAHWQRALRQMEQQTERLNGLAEDLVMLARLESTEPKTDREPVGLYPILSTIVEGARTLWQDSHTLELKCEPGLTLAGEKRELQSAFSNLVDNAIQHNPQGCAITVSARRVEGGVRVRVADDGVGIDPQHLPRLTERFYRVDSSRATATGGTGLGLAIVKHVLNRHHGSLRIRSTLGRGSIFTCFFRD